MWEVAETGNGNGATFEVNGNTYDVEVGADLKETVLGFARDAGYQKFRFYIDGEEVLPQNAPSVIEDGKAYKITPYDVAG